MKKFITLFIFLIINRIEALEIQSELPMVNREGNDSEMFEIICNKDSQMLSVRSVAIDLGEKPILKNKADSLWESELIPENTRFWETKSLYNPYQSTVLCKISNNIEVDIKKSLFSSGGYCGVSKAPEIRLSIDGIGVISAFHNAACYGNTSITNLKFQKSQLGVCFVKFKDAELDKPKKWCEVYDVNDLIKKSKSSPYISRNRIEEW